jgi:hypothetical protein
MISEFEGVYSNPADPGQPPWTRARLPITLYPSFVEIAREQMCEHLRLSMPANGSP